jgi:heat shock protein HtpX
MSKYFQIGLVLLYINLVSFAALIALTLAGVTLTGIAVTGAMACWLMFCLVVALVLPDVHLFLYPGIRKPVLAEEEKMHRAFQDVEDRARCPRPIRLLVEENDYLAAFAIGRNTIVISKGMLERVEPEELKGVMAHELGHLISRDTFIVCAFAVASQAPRFARGVYRFIKGLFSITLGVTRRINILLGFVLLLSIGLILRQEHLVLPLFALILFVLFFYCSDKLFRFFWLIIFRHTEYKQDAFARSLGYGPGLRRALERIAREDLQEVSRGTTLTRGTYPIIYARIRRLERLEGLR